MNELKNVYIIDKLANLGAYAQLSANFRTACDFIAKTDLTTLAKGRNPIDGDAVYANADAPTYVLPEDRRAEVHAKYFDIHVPLTEDERIGLAVYDARQKTAVDPTSDTGFPEQRDVTWFTLHPGEFCITWPITCLHIPAVTTDVVKSARKIVFKVLN